MKTILNCFKKFNDGLEPVNRWIAFLILVIGSIVGFHLYVARIVKNIVLEKSTIDNISANIRPVIIFDSEERFLAGVAAINSLVKKIKITKEKSELGFIEVKEIIVETKDLQATPPILESLDARYRIDEKRGSGFQWIYTLQPINSIVDTNSAENKRIQRFKLEFIP